jgi:adenylyltransferase/sulfurtransferase
VLLVGCGALGTHLAEFCVRAGVGALAIVDRDIVEESNLQRQSLFTEDDAAQAMPKAEAARRALARVNSEVAITAHVDDFTFRNAERLADGATLILDGTDNFETRFLINDLAVKTGTPWVYTGCVSSRATCMPVIPGKTACLRCILEDQPAAGGETCDTTGIIMPAVLQAVAWATGAALKLLSGNADALIPKMMTADVWSGERTVLDTSTQREECATCAGREFDWLHGKRAVSGAVLCGRHTVHIASSGEINVVEAAERIAALALVTTQNEFLLRAESDGLALTLYRDGRALVHGTDDPARARSFFAALVG